MNGCQTWRQRRKWFISKGKVCGMGWWKWICFMNMERKGFKFTFIWRALFFFFRSFFFLLGMCDEGGSFWLKNKMDVCAKCKGGFITLRVLRMLCCLIVSLWQKLRRIGLAIKIIKVGEFHYSMMQVWILFLEADWTSHTLIWVIKRIFLWLHDIFLSLCITFEIYL